MPTGDELLQEEMESDGVEKPKTQPTETDNLDLPHLDKHMDIDSMLSEGTNLPLSFDKVATIFVA